MAEKEPMKFSVTMPAQGAPGFEYSQQLEPIITEINKETDRGVALFSASILDQVLESILSSFLIEGKVSKSMFKYPQPLSSFSARQNMCLSLGLITQNEYGACGIIRGIRNKFAHNATVSVTFKQAEITKEIFKLPTLVTPGPSEFNDEHPRDIFIIAVTVLHAKWVRRIKYAEENKLKSLESSVKTGGVE